MENQQTKEFYEFGAFQIDVRNRLLFCGGEPVALNLKEFEVLLFLVLNAGEVVEKDALLTGIWHETFVEEATLARNISRLRKKLELDGADRIIETLPKRGYRFLPAVTRREQTAAAPAGFVEEKTIRRMRVEETIFLTPEEFQAANFNGANFNPASSGEVLTNGTAHNLLPTAAENPPSAIRHPQLLWLIGGIALTTIFFGGYLLFLRQPTHKPLLASHVTAFSGLAGREEAPAFSPDGKQLVYTWNGGAADAPGDVYVRLVNGGEPVRLTDTPDVQEMYPVFSPDGTNIAFVRDYKPDMARLPYVSGYKTYGEVFLIPALGGTERRIARLFSGNFSISFAPDGKSLAVIDTEDSTEDKQAAVYLIDIATGARRRVTAPAEFLYETTPRFAPDGKSIAFVRVFEGQQQDMFTVSLDSAAPQTLRQITFDRTVIHCLTWSADGANIFFISLRGDSHNPALWRVPVTGGEPEIVTVGSREISNLTAASDGKTIAFVDNVPRNFDIWQTAIGDRQAAKSFLNATYTENSPAFTPDGKNIVFSSWRSEKPELWMTDRAGKNLRQLTATVSVADDPSVSPDNSRVAFESFDGVSAIVSTVEIETGKSSNLTALQNYQIKFQPAWSADGKWIYFPSDRTGAMNIWKVAADGASKATQLTSGGAAKAIPAPDGKTVYFLKEKDSSEVWQISSDGGDERPAPEFAAVGDFKGVWTNTARGIYFFIKTAENDSTVKFFDFASRQLKTVGSIRSPVEIYGIPAVAPDGKQILFARYNPNASNIMLAEIEK